MNLNFRASVFVLFAVILVVGCKQSSDSPAGGPNEPKIEAPVGEAGTANPKHNIGEVMEYLEEAKRDKAKLAILTLEKAVKTYQIRYDNELPESLVQVTQYLAAPDEALVDPWGKKFQYAPKNDPKDGPSFEIWTIAPNGTRIDNSRKK